MRAATLRTLCATCAAFILIGAGASASASVMSVGPGSVCAVRAHNKVYCWGKNYITHTQTPVPVLIPGVEATQVADGFHYVCAITLKRTVVCWGNGNDGTLGNGSTEDSAVPVEVQGINNAVQVSASGVHVCAVLSTGHVVCWGRNYKGALGNGSPNEMISAVPVPVSGITNAVSVSSNDHFDETCALLATGAVDCWGANHVGQLGNGTLRDSYTPVQVSGITDATSVAAGGQRACAVLKLGKLVCWGQQVLTPTAVIIPPVTSVSVAWITTCAVLVSGEARCWGANAVGQNGSGHIGGTSGTPSAVLGLQTVVAISTGAFHDCAELASGQIACWGYNDYGDLGADLKPGKYSTPQRVEFPGELPASAPAAAVEPSPATEPVLAPVRASETAKVTVVGTPKAPRTTPPTPKVPRKVPTPKSPPTVEAPSTVLPTTVPVPVVAPPTTTVPPTLAPTLVPVLASTH
jgi:alpha-tubulin suppressor-like RCC1 family protein